MFLTSVCMCVATENATGADYVVEKMMRNVLEIESQSDNHALLKLFCDAA